VNIIAIYNIKGGVGKTATAVNLSYLSASTGTKTLLCDMDSQGSATYYFRIRTPKKFTAKKLLKGGAHIEKNIRGTDFPDLDLLPSDFSYRNIDIELGDFKKSTQQIKKILKPLSHEYGNIFIDCPPNITLISENIFHASDCIIVPLIPTTLSILALKQLIVFLKKIGRKGVRLMIFFSMVEKRKNMHTGIMRSLQGKPAILNSIIPFLADIEKMGIYRQPVTAALPQSLAALSYQSLWKEISGRL